MDLLQAILLGVLQGITEWLPISSSGHLALVQNFSGLDVPVVFDVFLHIGTLVAVCVVYRKDIVAMLLALLKLDFKSREFNTVLLIVLAMIPTAIIGFSFKPFFESMFKSNLQIGAALVVTGLLLYVASRKKTENKEASPLSSLIVGIAQGISVAPGISRSGTTISAGLLQGIDAKEAARFSFLLSIPAIIGAAAFELKDSAVALDSASFLPFLAGAAAAAVVGYLSIGFLIMMLEEINLAWFAYYCGITGAAAIALSVI